MFEATLVEGCKAALIPQGGMSGGDNMPIMPASRP
jgi:hypothetical protein